MLAFSNFCLLFIWHRQGGPIVLSKAVLVTFILPRKDTMAKVTYKRRHSVGGLLTVSEGKSTAIVTGGMAAGVALEWQLRRISSPPAVFHTAGREHERLGLVWAFEAHCQ